MEVNGDTIEDACLLHLVGDGQHINLVELDALKGINRVCHRQAMVLLLVTDFLCSPLDLRYLTRKASQNTKAAGEMMVGHCLEYYFIMDMKLVKSN